MPVNINSIINELEKLANREAPVSVADPIALSTALRSHIRHGGDVSMLQESIRAKLLIYLDTHWDELDV